MLRAQRPCFLPSQILGVYSHLEHYVAVFDLLCTLRFLALCNFLIGSIHSRFQNTIFFTPVFHNTRLFVQNIQATLQSTNRKKQMKYLDGAECS